MRQQCLEPFNYVKMNEWCWIELLVLNNKYLKPFNCEQIKLLVSDGNAWSHLTECKWNFQYWIAMPETI